MYWEAQRARTEQLPPSPNDWSSWLYLAGRGAGKTRTSAEWLVWNAVQAPVRCAVVAPTFSDARDTCVEGESGLLAIINRYKMLESWNRSQGALRLTNGSMIRLYSGEEPERLRGPQHHYAWVDELAAFKYARDSWDQLRFGLRLGDHPKTVISTTPKPIPLIKELLARDDGTIVVTRGSTFDNAENLPKDAVDELYARYEGTRLGRQELHGEILDDVEGALFNLDQISANRVTFPGVDVRRRVVAIDPAVTATEHSDETGIIVASVTTDGHYYVEGDHSLRGSPDEWAKRAVRAVAHYDADAIIVETNNGGDMLAATIRTVDPDVKIEEVRASRGKAIRAEPIAALYEQGRVHHVGTHDVLETQMITWTPLDKTSPDRLDALVWALTSLTSAKQIAPARLLVT